MPGIPGTWAPECFSFCLLEQLAGIPHLKVSGWGVVAILHWAGDPGHVGPGMFQFLLAGASSG